MQRGARRGLVFFLVLTLGILTSFVLVSRGFPVSLGNVYEPGPGTSEASLIASLILLWCLIVTVLWWLSGRKVTKDTLLLFVGAVVISLVYLTFLREHVWFGDYRAYLDAAKAMRIGAPLPERYLYPPFWAFLLSIIQSSIGGVLGDRVSVLFCFVLNHLSIVGFFVLGSLFLSRCGLSRAFSSLLLFAAMIVNVPILRNMVYVQVNLLFIDLVLASVLVLRRSVLLSALLFALATHLKVVPLLFVPVFLYRKEYRWVICYGLFCAAIAWVTTLSGGIGYYRDFAENLMQWRPAAVRSCSIYGLLKSTNRVFGSRLPADGLFNLTRAVLGLWVYALSFFSIRREVFARLPDARSAGIINGLVPAMFLMPIVAPTVWVYHLVILIIPAVLALGYMRGMRRLGLWSLGYFFTFLLPTFDFYPWSYLRLVGWLALLLALSYAVLSPRTSRWVDSLDRAVSAAVAGVVDEVAAVFRRIAAR